MGTIENLGNIRLAVIILSVVLLLCTSDAQEPGDPCKASDTKRNGYEKTLSRPGVSRFVNFWTECKPVDGTARPTTETSSAGDDASEKTPKKEEAAMVWTVVECRYGSKTFKPGDKPTKLSRMCVECDAQNGPTKLDDEKCKNPYADLADLLIKKVNADLKKEKTDSYTPETQDQRIKKMSEDFKTKGNLAMRIKYN